MSTKQQKTTLTLEAQQYGMTVEDLMKRYSYTRDQIIVEEVPALPSAPAGRAEKLASPARAPRFESTIVAWKNTGDIIAQKLAVAQAVLRYYGIEVVDEIAEGVTMLCTGEKPNGTKDSAFVRIIPGGSYAKDQSELKLLRAALPSAPTTCEPTDQIATLRAALTELLRTSDEPNDSTLDQFRQWQAAVARAESILAAMKVEGGK